MKSLKACLVVSVIGGVLGTAVAGTLTPIAQTRSVSATADATGTGADQQSDSATAPDFSPWFDSVGANAHWFDPNNTSSGSASATQSSEIHPTIVLGNGSVEASADATGPFATGSGAGDSTLQVTFDVAQLCTFTLDADLNGFAFGGAGDGIAGVLLLDSSGTSIAFDEVQNNARTLSVGGVLPPDTYTLMAYAYASALAEPFMPLGSGSASFDVSFELFEGGCPGVSFESQPVGTQYGSVVGAVPGDLAFTEFGIDTTVAFFNFVSGGGTFLFAQIEPAFPWFGVGRIINTNNINLGFDLSGTPNGGLEIDLADLGGEENIEVNGAGLFVGEITAAPPAIAPGVTLSFVGLSGVPGGYTARLRLDGPVDHLLIGGQEFYLDDLCLLPAAACPGDTDGDGDVDLTDIATVLGQFGKVGSGLSGDVNGDGTVDLSDLSLVLANFGSNCS